MSFKLQWFSPSKRRSRTSWQGTLYIEDVRGEMGEAVESGAISTWLRAVDWTKYKKMPDFSSNNRSNAYRTYLKLTKVELDMTTLVWTGAAHDPCEAEED